MPEAAWYPRFATPRLLAALGDSPVVLVHGPRQCGKTSLVRRICEPRGYVYFSFDDPAVLSAASSDPSGFVADLPKQVILDEVQRVPSLFSSIKLSVDRDRRPGRFVLTGSANVLLLPTLSDSLAGRMETVRLHPLSRAELDGRDAWLPASLFSGLNAGGSYRRLGPLLAERIAAGGYPAALARSTNTRRAAWYRDYIDALVQRDVRELSRIRALDVLPDLLSAVAGQSARLLNVSGLASPFHVSRVTIGDYVTLLERLFLVEIVPPWHSNRLSRLVKTPKAHLGDSGVACALLGLDAAALYADREAYGQLVETYVYQEIRRQASGLDAPLRFHHFRDKDGAEVDIVIERAGRELAGVEVKAASTVTERDFSGLRKLRAAAGKRFRAGIVVYDGEAAVAFGDDLFALPVSAL